MFLTEIIDHVSRRGNAMRELARWHHPVASREALNVLHRVIHPASYRRIRMAIEIIVNLPEVFFALISLLATILS